MKLKNISAICVLALAIVWPASTFAEPFPMPKFPERETRTTKIHYEGKKLDMKKATLSQQLLYKTAPNRLDSEMYWEGEGAKRHIVFIMKEQQNNKNATVNTFHFKPSRKYLILDSYERVVKNSAGKQLKREFCLVGHPSEGFPDDLMHSYTMEVAFRGLKLDQPGYMHHYNFWFPPSMVIPMEAKVKGTETITVPIGKRKCYRVDIKPFMGAFVGKILGRIIQPLIPSYTFWFDCNGTNPLLKYRGPLGKVNIIGVPDEVYEVIEINPDPSK